MSRSGPLAPHPLPPTLPALLRPPPSPLLCYCLTTLLQQGPWERILRCKGTFFIRRARGKPSGFSLCTARLCYSRRPHVAALWAAMVSTWERTQRLLWSKYLFWHWVPLCGLGAITLVLHFSFPSCKWRKQGLGIFGLFNSAILSSDEQPISRKRNVWFLHTFSFLKQNAHNGVQKITSKVSRFSGFYSSLSVCIPFFPSFTFSNDKMRKRREWENKNCLKEERKVYLTKNKQANSEK